MIHEFKLIPRDESIVVREDAVVEAATAKLKEAKPEGKKGHGIDWPEPLAGSREAKKIASRIARRGGFRVGQECSVIDENSDIKDAAGMVSVRFYRLGESKPRKAKGQEEK